MMASIAGSNALAIIVQKQETKEDYRPIQRITNQLWAKFCSSFFYRDSFHNDLHISRASALATAAQKIEEDGDMTEDYK